MDRARQVAQGFTAAREPRTDGPYRDIENRGDLSVAHSLQADEQDHRPLRTREFSNSTPKIAQLEPPSLLRGSGELWIALTQSDGHSFPRRPPNVIDVLVVKYREQPRPQVCSLLPKMQSAEGTGQALLYEIVRCNEIARQRAGIASQAGNFGFNVPIWVGQRELLPRQQSAQEPI